MRAGLEGVRAGAEDLCAAVVALTRGGERGLPSREPLRASYWQYVAMTFEMLTMQYLWMGAVGRRSERFTRRITVATAIDTWRGKEEGGAPG